MQIKPVAIFQHTDVGHPGAVLPLLDQLSVPWVIIPIKDGAPVPQDPSPYSGLVFMGGAMGVNDGLQWVEEQKRLIRQADEQGLPIIGHCLGSQIMAAAFGAEVRLNRRVEIGWQTVNFNDTPQAQEWFGVEPEPCVFQWHADTFDLPQNAVHLASSENCDNQAYVLNDRHLGMQFHLEMTPEIVRQCMEANRAMMERELAAGNPAVNSQEKLLSHLDRRTAAMHRTMAAAYKRWVRGLKRD